MFVELHVTNTSFIQISKVGRQQNQKNIGFAGRQAESIES